MKAVLDLSKYPEFFATIGGDGEMKRGDSDEGDEDEKSRSKNRNNRKKKLKLTSHNKYLSLSLPVSSKTHHKILDSDGSTEVVVGPSQQLTGSGNLDIEICLPCPDQNLCAWFSHKVVDFWGAETIENMWVVMYDGVLYCYDNPFGGSSVLRRKIECAKIVNVIEIAPSTWKTEEGAVGSTGFTLKLLEAAAVGSSMSVEVVGEESVETVDWFWLENPPESVNKSELITGSSDNNVKNKLHGKDIMLQRRTQWVKALLSYCRHKN